MVNPFELANGGPDPHPEKFVDHHHCQRSRYELSDRQSGLSGGVKIQTSDVSAVHVILAPERQDRQPVTYCPRALVVAEVEGTFIVHSVYEENREAVLSRTSANLVILPVVEKWLRRKGWRTYDVFSPQIPSVPRDGEARIR